MTQRAGTDYLFTSESVTEGHPDKIADQISDAVVDAALAADPGARVACETLITTGLVVLAGEITAPPGIDYAQLARDTIGDAGVTGRKIIVDTYGGFARHGGGAFSGKDPSKVDRSAAYAARYVAKNLVAAGLAGRVEVQVAYAIGVARPVSVMVETFDTEAVPRSVIEKLVHENFDLRPAAFRDYLDLAKPRYAKTAAHGHFGRDEPEFTWERTDRVAALAGAAGTTPLAA